MSAVFSSLDVPMATTSGPKRPPGSVTVLGRSDPNAGNSQLAKRARIGAADDALTAVAGKNSPSVT
jgi:hypothetical protein